MDAMDKVNLAEKLSMFSEHYKPRIVGQVNDCLIKLVKFKGEFVWHHHDVEDEMFYVVRGEMTMKLGDRDVRLRDGEFLIVPRGVEHMPVAEREVHVMLIEPASTLNTGNLRNDRTVEQPEYI
jgi:mannose-6-phosphate isomerase-like protein (cupin superfamily)